MAKKPFVILFIGFFSLIIHAKGQRFQFPCEVYEKPNPKSQVICKKKSGAPIENVKIVDVEFSEISTEGCAGYVSNSCISTGGEPPRKERKRRLALNDSRSSSSERSWEVGIFGDLGALWGKGGENTSFGKGLQYSGGAIFLFKVAEKIRFSVYPVYRSFRLTRTVDGSGSLSDVGYIEYTQKYSLLGGGTLLSFNFEGGDKGTSDPRFWIDGGLEYLTSLSGSQTDSKGGSVSFSPSDKFVFLIIGLAIDYPLSKTVFMSVSVPFFYNLAASQGDKLLGLRGQLALFARL